MQASVHRNILLGQLKERVNPGYNFKFGVISGFRQGVDEILLFWNGN
jgi:hypothetical protein